MKSRIQALLPALAVTFLLSSQAARGLEPLSADQQQSQGDYYELPSLPNSGGMTNDPSAAGLPPLPGNETPVAASGMPPLPSSSPSTNGLPPLPGQESASPGGPPPLPGQAPASPSAMPPLPGGTTAAPMAPGEMPPLPSEMQAYDQKQAQEAAKEAPKPSGEKRTVEKAAPEPRPWERTKKRVNTIFGGWVLAKGGNESSRIAWASQEAMNALAFKGFKILKEDGLYEGQRGAEGNQWRLITFQVPGSERTLEVFVRQIDTRVWMRIGPSEPPPFSIHSVSDVKKIRGDSLKALKLVRAQIGKRFKPHKAGSWEAPYSYYMATADKKPVY